MEVNLPFLLCFTLSLKAIFQVQAPGGAYIRRGNLTEGFLPHDFGRLIFGGAFTSRGLFSEFYGTSKCDDGYIFVKRGRLMYIISLIRGKERCVMTL